MTRVSLILLLALVGSAMLLVHSAYDARRLYAAIDRAKSEARQLDVEYKRLDAERQAQATPLLVERTAREKLRMRAATPAVTFYAVDNAASGSGR